MTSKKNKATKEVVVQSNAEVSTDTNGGDFHAQLTAESNAPAVPILTPKDWVNKMFTDHGPEIAKKCFGLVSTIQPADVGDMWRPALISIASKKGHNEAALANAGAGGLYFHDTKLAVPEGTVFFPIATHVEHTWWDDSGKALCRSMDGLMGSRFAGPLTNTVVPCSTEDCPNDACPNTPAQYQKSGEECKWTRTVVCVDRDLTNLFTFTLRYYSIKETYDTMLKATKSMGRKFVPDHNSWMSMSTFSKGEGTKTGWYLKANPTDQKLDDGEVAAIHQIQAMYSTYHKQQVYNRDNRENAQKSEVDTLSVTTKVREDGATISELAEDSSPDM